MIGSGDCGTCPTRGVVGGTWASSIGAGSAGLIPRRPSRAVASPTRTGRFATSRAFRCWAARPRARPWRWPGAASSPRTVRAPPLQKETSAGRRRCATRRVRSSACQSQHRRLLGEGRGAGCACPPARRSTPLAGAHLPGRGARRASEDRGSSSESPAKPRQAEAPWVLATVARRHQARERLSELVACALGSLCGALSRGALLLVGGGGSAPGAALGAGICPARAEAGRAFQLTAPGAFGGRPGSWTAIVVDGPRARTFLAGLSSSRPLTTSQRRGVRGSTRACARRGPRKGPALTWGQKRGESAVSTWERAGRNGRGDAQGRGPSDPHQQILVCAVAG